MVWFPTEEVVEIRGSQRLAKADVNSSQAISWFQMVMNDASALVAQRTAAWMRKLSAAPLTKIGASQQRQSRRHHGSSARVGDKARPKTLFEPGGDGSR